jgi:hypothetical protein
MQVLDLEECLKRLRSSPVGRLAFVARRHPGDPPGEPRVDGTTVVFATTWGSKLSVAEQRRAGRLRGGRLRPATGAGGASWSRVTASRVYDSSAVDRYEKLLLPSWTPPVEDVVWIAIRADEITGRVTTRLHSCSHVHVRALGRSCARALRSGQRSGSTRIVTVSVPA